MKRIYTLLYVLVFALLPQIAQAQRTMFNEVFAPSEGFINKAETDYRHEICLNGYWDFQPVDVPTSFVYGSGVAPELPQPTENKWETNLLKVPSPWNVNGFADSNNQGPDFRSYPSYPKEWEKVKMAWMRKNIIVPQNWDGERIKLHFEAVAGFAEIYVNGQKVAENFDLFLPFDVDITAQAKAGKAVEIMVGVRSQWLFENTSTIGRRVIPAGSMWGTYINGIWQDVYLYAMPQINISNIFIKPLLSKNKLEIETTIENNTNKTVKLNLGGTVNDWVNLANKDNKLSAPLPLSKIGDNVLVISNFKISLAPNSKQKVTLTVDVSNGTLKEWTPENPNLYALLLSAKVGNNPIDLKYERFGWREWTISSTQHLLNGKPYALRGDSWHFMGMPQMTRRYAWAWYSAIKAMNGNAVRLHAQVFPKFYMDMADEMGICVLDETASWGSDGGPKYDSDTFWEHSKEHLRRFVLRDRNHPSVFGWSVSNENRPVVLYVMSRPDLMPRLETAWKEWLNIVNENDGTRAWISSDGEDDGNGLLPVTIGHYGDEKAMENWAAIGKPWGIGEHSMAYYGTPEQVSKYNAERAYESQLGRMEGLAKESFGLIKDMRNLNASYSTVFNMVWYGLKPLPLGKKNTSVPVTINDGIFFPDYVEGRPGVQPERLGPYSTTLNPGYDSSLPLYETWPMFDGMSAANGGKEYIQDGLKIFRRVEFADNEPINKVMFVGSENSKIRQMLEAQGVKFANKITKGKNEMMIVDGSQPLTKADTKLITKSLDKGNKIWIWGITPATIAYFNSILPEKVELDTLSRSSLLPNYNAWMKGLVNSDFYFSELQNDDVIKYTIKGDFVNDGEVLLQACKTDWRRWNKQAEAIKTASVLRSELETTQALPVMVSNGNVCITTLYDFANSDKGFNTLGTMLINAGVISEKVKENPAAQFFLRDGKILFPKVSKDYLTPDGEGYKMSIYVYSNRPLDDLLIEPNMPKLTLELVADKASLMIGNKEYTNFVTTGNRILFNELQLKQGWNHLIITLPGNAKQNFEGSIRCENQPDFLQTVKVSFQNQKLM